LVGFSNQETEYLEKLVYNKVILVGNLTRDPELKFIANGNPVCRFGLATNRSYTSNGEKKEEVTFVDIDVWGKPAENCAKYLEKGKKVLVEGRLKLDTWEADGQKRSKLFINADSVQFLTSPSSKEQTKSADDVPVGDDSPSDVPF
jgi:single-strand DNA-binding protein